MALHPVDQEIYKHRFGTEEMRAIWGEENLLQKRLDVEAAVARAELALGIIPEWAANEIIEKCNTRHVTLELASQFKFGSDIVAMIKASEKVMGDASEYMHFGLTSQDILESSLPLVIRETWKVFMRDMRELESILLNLAEKHKTDVMPGRPHGQYGTVITFGFKTAVWAGELRRHIERLMELRNRMFVGNLTGSHGTYAPLKGMGMKVEEESLKLLDLKPAPICTHTTRDRLIEFMTFQAQLGGFLERVCRVIYELHRPEIFELEGPFVEGQQVDSSTMPHRRGPSGVDWTIGFARILRGNALVALECIVEDDRDAARLPFEHASLPESCLLTASSLASMIKYLKALKVHTENMEKDVCEYLHGRGQAGPFIQGESMLYAVAEKTKKKQSAHKMVYRIAQQAFHDKETFRDALIKDPELRSYLSVEEIDKALDPHQYIGEAPQAVEKIVRLATEARQAEEATMKAEGLM